MQQLSRKIDFLSQTKQENEGYSMPEIECFCCDDSGLIKPYLVKKVIPDYNIDRQNNDAMPVCNRCNARHKIPHNWQSRLDDRITKETCESLHLLSKADWEHTIALKNESKKQTIVKNFTEKF